MSLSEERRWALLNGPEKGFQVLWDKFNISHITFLDTIFGKARYRHNRATGWLGAVFQTSSLPVWKCKQQRHTGRPQTTTWGIQTSCYFFPCPLPSLVQTVVPQIYTSLWDCNAIWLDRSMLSRWQEVDIHLSTVWLWEDTPEWASRTPCGKKVAKACTKAIPSFLRMIWSIKSECGYMGQLTNDEKTLMVPNSVTVTELTKQSIIAINHNVVHFTV